MNRQLFKKGQENRDRHGRVSDWVTSAQLLADMVQAQPQEASFEVRPDYASPAMVPISRTILLTALRMYLADKKRLLADIEHEFDAL